MADVDYSIAAKVQPPKFDPMATATQAIQLGQGMLSNRLLGQEVAGKIARGQAAQGAIDPNTGQFDPDAYMRNLRADPNGAQFAPEAAVQAQQQRLAQVQTITAAAAQKREQLGLSLDQGKVLSAGMLPFIQQFTTPGKDGKTPTPTKDDFVSTISSVLAAMGQGADPNVITRAADLVKNAKDDPQALMQTARNLALLGNPTPETISAVLGSPVQTDTGPGVVVTRTPTLGGAPQVAGVLDKGLSPSDENTPAYTYTDKAGVQHVVTKRAAAAAPSGASPPAGIESGAPYGVAEGLKGQAEESHRMAQTWHDAADTAKTTKAQLENLRDQVGRFTSGPKATWSYRVNALATQLGVATPKMKDEAAAQEEWNKLASQFINGQVGAIGGGGTDSKLAAAMHGSPNELMTSQGVTGVLALMEGLEDAKIAKQDAWQKWLDHGHTPDTAQQFDTQWNKLFNPRVFQAQYMSPAQRANMLRGMSADERKSYVGAEANAKKWGWTK